MKKLFFYLLSVFALNANAGNVELNVTWDDPTNIGYPIPKSPVLVPEVSLEDHTLYFFTPCDGCTLNIVDENDDVVYTLVIPSGTTSLALPSDLSGEYELQIIRGNYCFWGTITL